MNKNEVVQVLIKRGNELLSLPYKKVEFTKIPESDDLLNDLNRFPHAFVVACVMDRQIKAERAWLIPYYISQEIKGFDISQLLTIGLDSLKDIFAKRSLHRFNDVMAKNFYSALQLIHEKYNDIASNIWKDNPKSATIVRRFLEFEGVGVKISTMATNILARDFKILMQDKVCIDISPDVQVKKVFTRLGFIPKGASTDELIYSAKELYPEYPGIFDLSVWEIGRQWCRPQNPDCKSCYLSNNCQKNI